MCRGKKNSCVEHLKHHSFPYSFNSSVKKKYNPLSMLQCRYGNGIVEYSLF